MQIQKACFFVLLKYTDEQNSQVNNEQEDEINMNEYFNVFNVFTIYYKKVFNFLMNIINKFLIIINKLKFKKIWKMILSRRH